MSFLEIDESNIASALSGEAAVLDRIVEEGGFADLFTFSVGEFVDPESVELRMYGLVTGLQ